MRRALLFLLVFVLSLAGLARLAASVLDFQALHPH